MRGAIYFFSKAMADVTKRELRYRVSGRMDLAADVYGAPENPPVILMHGGGQTRHAWGSTAETLAAAGFYALSLDLRGHGDSKTRMGRNGQPEEIDPSRLRRDDLNRMVLDVEAVKKFMLKQNNEGKLNIDKTNASTGGNRAVPRTRSGSTPSSAELEQIRDRLRNAAPPNPDTGPTGNRSSGLEDYAQRLRQDPMSVLGEVGLSAVNDGESGGYRVDASAQSAIRQAGLQPGDVVVSVNGRPIGNVMNDTALIDQVMASSRVRVEVQRGERRFFLTVPVPK